MHETHIDTIILIYIHTATPLDIYNIPFCPKSGIFICPRSAATLIVPENYDDIYMYLPPFCLLPRNELPVLVNLYFCFVFLPRF